MMTDPPGRGDPLQSNSGPSKVAAVSPVKRLVAVLWVGSSAFDAAFGDLQNSYGAIDFRGPDHRFDVTDYYAREMGLNLQRTIVAFERLMPPESLVAAKLECNEIEARLAGAGKRNVNLDVGYLDHNKIVLASVKFAGQKIHLGSGVYADLIARFRHGRYEPFEWTFPDFRDGRYDSELAAIREKYLEQLRLIRRSSDG